MYDCLFGWFARKVLHSVLFFSYCFVAIVVDVVALPGLGIQLSKTALNSCIVVVVVSSCRSQMAIGISFLGVTNQSFDWHLFAMPFCYDKQQQRKQRKRKQLLQVSSIYH